MLTYPKFVIFLEHTTLCWRNENLIPLKLSFCSRDKSRGTLPSICCYGIYIQVDY
nr:MAG TPA: hypothetical protein [Caudoviricetes sp.]